MNIINVFLNDVGIIGNMDSRDLGGILRRA